MTSTLRALVRGTLAPPLLGLALITAGCASDEGSHDHARKDPAQKPSFPSLAGQETFFDGRIIAELKVGAMTGFDPGRTGPAEGSSIHGERWRVHPLGGGSGHREEGGGEPEAEPAGPNSATPEQARQRTARRAERMGSPPVMIHLRFTNTGSERVDLVVADFLSPLGNFVVQPEKLSLDPGQAVEVEPMTSRLAGEVTGGEISLNLRLGSRQETKTVTLQPEPSPAAPDPAPRP